MDLHKPKKVTSFNIRKYYKFAETFINRNNMPVISSKEFAINQKKYLDLAISKDIFIKRGKNKFVISNANQCDEFLEPDEDFRRALSAEEFKKRARVVVENAYKRFTNERSITP